MQSKLITYSHHPNKDYLQSLKYVLHDHIYVLHNNPTWQEKKPEHDKKIELRYCPQKNDITDTIDKIFEEDKSKSMILPYFDFDAFSKYSIIIYNRTFNTGIDPQTFQYKNKMNDFIQDIIQKNNFVLDYETLITQSYQTISKKIKSPLFILKPVNTASSVLNFRIDSEQAWLTAQEKLLKKYDYLIEEYIDGHLYSIDFFCNGRDVFLLCYAREIPYAEILNQLSFDYLKKYEDQISQDFMHFLPIRYTLDLSKLVNYELRFIKKVGQKLIENNYRGFIHLEYKIRRRDKKIGFIEWGARLGGRRPYFIQHMHNNLRAENIPFDILYRQDNSFYVKKNGLYFLRRKHPEKNFFGVKTTVLEKMHIMDLMRKIPNLFNVSLEEHLSQFFWDHWKIRFNRVMFDIKTSPDHYLYPFYKRNDTKFNFFLELDQKNFDELLTQKNKVVQQLVFHDWLNIKH